MGNWLYKSKILLGLILIFLFICMSFAQVSAQSSYTVPQKYPGIYIVDESTLSHDPYDPGTNYETLGGSIIQEIYEGLYTYNGNNISSYRPLLATNYAISPNGLNYTFTIRKNVTFTDGSPLNAYVFQYSIQRAIIMNDPSSGIWILDQSIRNASWIGNMTDENITQANAFLANMSVHANNEYSLSIYINKPSAAFIPELIFNAADAVSPSWIITHEPSSYSTNQSDANIYGMVSLNKMFPQLDNASIRKYLGLKDTTAFPSLANSGIDPQSAHDDPQVGYTYMVDHAMGTGPYILSSETAGVSITLERNNNWWNRANFHKDSKGTIDAPQEVLIKVVPEVTSRVADIKNNEAHQAYIPSSNLGEIMNNKTLVPYINNINIYKYPSLVTGVLAFNENTTIASAGQIAQSNTASGYNEQYIKEHNLVQYTWKNSSGSTQYASPGNPFSALLFRKAFAYAWDYTGYMNDVLGGQYNRLDGIIPKDLFGHQSDLIEDGYIPSQNLILAKQLFQKVNWKGSVTINYNSGDTQWQEASQLLAKTIDNLNVGISIKIAEIQWSIFPGLYYNYPPALSFKSWFPDYADASDYVVPFLHTGGVFPSFMHYSNPYVDQLMDKADAMRTNNATKNALYRQMEINASGDYPYIYLYQANNIAVINRWATDWNSAYAGNENPLDYGTQYQYVGLEAYTPNTATTTQTDTTIVVGIGSNSPNGISLFLINLASGGFFALLFTIAIIIPGTIIVLVVKNPKSIKKIKNITKAKEKIKERTKKPSPISEETFNTLEQIINENTK